MKGALALSVVLAACGQPRDERTAVDQTPTPSASPAATIALSVPPAPPQPITTSVGTANACARFPLVAPAVLARSWPQLLGMRVRVRLVPVRALSLTETLARGEGALFVVLGTPGAVTPSASYTVLGSTTVALNGPTVLPELVAEANDGC